MRRPTLAWLAHAVAAGAAAAALAYTPSAPSLPDEVAAPVGERLSVVRADDTGRWLRHRGGVTRAPLRAERICALQFVDELVLLGVTPAGVSTDWRGAKVDFLADALADCEPIPHGLGAWLPSYEAIAALSPDLILAWSADRHSYEQLARIAPTVVVRTLRETLDENGDLAQLEARLEDIALAIGRPSAAHDAIAAFRAKLDAARTRLAAPMAGKTIAFLRARGRQWRLYGVRDECGGEALYDGLGLRAPQLVAERGMELDPERLIELDADYLVVVADPLLASEQSLARLRAHPLWRRVPAVARGQVLHVSALDHWILSGLGGKSRMIDDVLACVSGEPRR